MLKLLLNFFYVVLVSLVLLGYYYVSLDKLGILIAGFLFLFTSLFAEFNVFKLPAILRVLLFFVLVASVYLAIGTWMVNNSPGGAYSPVTGVETRAWWINGAYTKFGESLVWRWVSWGVYLYVVAEILRQSRPICKFIASSYYRILRKAI